MARAPSPADHDLAQRFRRRYGTDLAPRRIQAFREVGLLVTPARDYPGGGGSSTRYPELALDQAHEAIELADRHPRRLSTAVLEMFARGNFPIAEPKLKRALLDAFERMEVELREAAGPGAEEGDDEHVAIEASPALAKRVARAPEASNFRRRIRRGAESRQSVLETVLANLTAIFLTGRALSEEGAAETLSAIGLTATLDALGATHLSSIGASLKDQLVGELFSLASVDRIRRVITGATVDEFEQARDEWKRVLGHLEPKLDVLRLSSADARDLTGLLVHTDLQVALGAVIILLLRKGRTGG